MPFAGGPFNNYVFQPTAPAAELLDAGPARTALVTCVSGVCTKLGFTVFSTEAPSAPFAAVDVTDEVERLSPALQVDEAVERKGEIVAYTLLSMAPQPKEPSQ